MDECQRRPPEVITHNLMRIMSTKLAAIEKAHSEDQAKLSLQIQTLRNEKDQLARMVEDLKRGLQQG